MKRYFLTRVELHYCEDRYDELHRVLDKIGFKRSWPVRGVRRQLPDATYLSRADSTASLMAVKLRAEVASKMKLGVRTLSSGRKSTYSFMVVSIDSLKSGGLLPKTSSLLDLMKLLKN